ncbi:hypothetical protein AAMO2058_000192200 [Amorphochlora amoebiformis]
MHNQMREARRHRRAPRAGHKRRKGDQKEDIRKMLFSSQLEEVRKALDMGADVNSRIAGNDTALMNAALKGHVKIAQLLIERKAAVNLTNKKQETVLHIAARYRRCLIVYLLSNTEVDVNARNRFGDTPLISAIRYYSNYSRETRSCLTSVYSEVVWALLFKGGADVCIKGGQGKTAFDWAVGCESILRDLRKALAQRVELALHRDMPVFRMLCDPILHAAGYPIPERKRREEREKGLLRIADR